MDIKRLVSLTRSQDAGCFSRGGENAKAYMGVDPRVIIARHEVGDMLTL